MKSKPFPQLTTLYSALVTPMDHFNTLFNQIVPDPDVHIFIDRSGLYAEAKVNTYDRGCAMIYMPLTPMELNDIPQLAHPTSELLCPYIVLRDELLFRDHIGDRYGIDIIVQYIPDGVPLYFSALTHQALPMLEELERECQRIGFSHNRLTEYDIIASDSGHLHPIRYHFATVDGANDDFESLKSTYRKLCEAKDKEFVYTSNDCELFEPLNGRIRFCKDGLFGYKDLQGNDVIPAKYLWATDFHERRAVIETETGFGAIDPLGEVVIEPYYENLYYNTDYSFFYSVIDGQYYGIGYTGFPFQPTQPEFSHYKPIPYELMGIYQYRKKNKK
ncbi:MAG: WG repeat-containing protein [Alistipes sp.]|nr:WG repeat-containing protein [Alistipes sp.]